MRRVMLLPLLTTTLVVGCVSVAEPSVTFYAAGRSVSVRPSQFCTAPADAPDAAGLNCPAGDNTARLRVPPGAPVQISVPSAAADGIWHVAMGYRTEAGEQHAVGSRNFVAGTESERRAFTVRLPTERDQLELVQVRSVRESDGRSITLGVWTLQVG